MPNSWKRFERRSTDRRHPVRISSWWQCPGGRRCPYCNSVNPKVPGLRVNVMRGRAPGAKVSNGGNFHGVRPPGHCHYEKKREMDQVLSLFPFPVPFLAEAFRAEVLEARLHGVERVGRGFVKFDRAELYAHLVAGRETSVPVHHALARRAPAGGLGGVVVF
jgi:hypothetical protein